MINKAFTQLADEKKAQKFDVAIRNHTDNLLNANQIKTLVQDISLNRQYVISVHPVKQDSCEALVVKNVLHIYLPEHLYERKRGCK